MAILRHGNPELKNELSIIASLFELLKNVESVTQDYLII